MDPLCSFGGEELDYSISMRATGYRVLYEPLVAIKNNSLVQSGA